VTDLNYIVITPARNEAVHIGETIASMAAQRDLPRAWVIVNDGSTDATADIIEAAAREHSWIIPLHRPDRGARKQGSGVIEAFDDGLQLVKDQAWDFLVKFDADLSFDEHYFSRCLGKFGEDSSLGIGGGLICQEIDGKLVCESPRDPAFHVRGATKIYRRACWEAIGGLIRAPGWDTADELKANMLGWRTYSFADVPLRHHRFTGTADGTWNNCVKFGLSNYITRYHPLFMAAKCLRRTVQRPYLIGALGQAWGYCKGYLTKTARVDGEEYVRYVHRQQMNRLRNRPSLWDRTIGSSLPS
jgi:poly-beta-1,6-N-acetyl-D-glucosamine synthase